MVISCERPHALFSLALIVPVVLAEMRRYRGIVAYSKRIASVDTNLQGAKRMLNLSRTLVVRTLLRCFAWIMLKFRYKKAEARFPLCSIFHTV